jgi:hypothetical protein
VRFLCGKRGDTRNNVTEGFSVRGRQKGLGNAANAWTSLGFTTESEPGKYVSNVKINASSGAIVIALTNFWAGIDGTTVTAILIVGPGMITWKYECSSADLMIKRYFECQPG